ncbi:hypothetical protein [Brassicibacter mesophilus]|uniref:hypothetical protein n=1 Tax=Brassicibacter mesophilus TaxID=745119 RepID=UPI003D1C3E17
MGRYIEILIKFNEILVDQINISIPLFLKYYIVLKLEIIFILFLIDLLLVGLNKLNYNRYYKVKFKLIKKPSRLIKRYRVYIWIRNVINSARPWYIRRYDYKEGKELIDYIYQDGFLKYIKRLIISFFNPKYISSLIAFLATILFYYDIQFSTLIIRYFQLVSKENLITLLTLLPAIIIILIITIGWRYTSLRGRYIRGTNRLNQRIIEETLDIHRRISKPLLEVIDKASKNIEYALNCKNLLIRSRLRKISPYIDRIEDDTVVWSKYPFYNNEFRTEDYMFDNIEEVDELVGVINEAKKKYIYEEVFWIRYFDKDMFGLINLKRSSEKLEEILRFNFFTPYTLQKILKEDKKEVIYKEIQEQIPDEQKKGYYERQILKDIEEFKKRIDDILIGSIEKLVDLSLYHKSIYSLLHFNSNRLGRTLSYWTDRE